MAWISEGLFAALSFVLVLGVVVLVHELGHYVAARLVGVRVEVFSIGFGNRLFSWRRGATEFRVSLIPLGGYVRMAGEGSLEGEPTGAPDELESRRAWEKLLIFGAGPAFNVLLAVLLYSAAYAVGFPVPAFFKEPVVVAAVAPDSPAQRAGLVEGDRVVELDGREVASWESFEQAVLVRPSETVELMIERGERRLVVPVTLDAVGRNRVGSSGIVPWCRLELGRVLEDGAAAAAGLQPGDVIRSLDGERTCSTPQLAGLLQAGEGSARTLVVERGGVLSELELAARWDEGRAAWMIGIEPAPVPFVLERHGLLAAVAAGTRECWTTTVLIAETVGRLLTGRMSIRAMSGPVEIAGVASDAVQLGPLVLVRLIALISINLGILNLLPIPVLDGGRMAVVGFEAIRGRELGADAKEWILRAGLAMILALMFVVLFFDVVKVFEG